MENEQKTVRFNTAWRNLDGIYEDYAKEIGMTYTSLHVLNLIAILSQCTQSILCECAFLPKQTVNTIVTQFYKAGWIELREVPQDRRNKTIHLTDKGRNVADEYISHIMEAEHKAMETMTDEQSEQLIKYMKTYGEVFRATLLKQKN